jgi:hypothetical protein
MARSKLTKEPSTREAGQQREMPKLSGVDIRVRQEARTTLEVMYAQRYPKQEIIRTMRERYGLRKMAVYTMLDRVRASWAEQSEEERASNKAAQEIRLNQDLRRLRVRMADQKAASKPNDRELAALSGAVYRLESLLADIQGTREPIKVDVDIKVSQAIFTMIGTMGAEEVARELAYYEEIERRAQAYQAMVPQLTSGNANGAGH